MIMKEIGVFLAPPLDLPMLFSSFFQRNTIERSYLQNILRNRETIGPQECVLWYSG